MENSNQTPTSNQEPLVVTGTHNSMTYLTPSKWWMRPLSIFARCQVIDIESQLEAGAECVDLRVYMNRGSGWRFAHGLITYKGETLFNVLDKIERIKPDMFVRIILERGDDAVTKSQFAFLCKSIETLYPTIRFIGGFYKKTWEPLYNFKLNDIEIHQYVSSMADDARWYEKILPCLYACRVRKHTFKPGINLIDFMHPKS